MNAKTIGCVLLLLCLFGKVATAQNQSLYILYDPSCMHQYEYRSTDDNESNDYFDYHIVMNETDDFVLTVSANSEETQFFPKLVFPALSCANFQDQSFLIQLKEADAVYIVETVNGGYHLTKVKDISSYTFDKKAFSYTSMEGRFAFFYGDSYLKGEEIKSNKSEAFYLYQSTQTGGDGDRYVFKKIPRAAEFSSEVHYIKGIGLVEQRFYNRVMQLAAIDGYEVKGFKRTDFVGTTSAVPTEYGNTGNGVKTHIETTDMNSYTTGTHVIGLNQPSATPVPPNVPTSYNNSGKGDIEHIVRKGDTLYSLAKRHGSTVEALMRMNNLPSTLIKIKQVIRLQ